MQQKTGGAIGLVWSGVFFVTFMWVQDPVQGDLSVGSASPFLTGLSSLDELIGLCNQGKIGNKDLIYQQPCVVCSSPVRECNLCEYGTCYIIWILIGFNCTMWVKRHGIINIWQYLR